MQFKELLENSGDISYTGVTEFKKTQRFESLDGGSPDRIAVQKLQEFCEEYLERFGEDPSEWQRKTSKVVLAVLVCHNPDPNGLEFLSFRGMNFELSQPTGSRCAEQCAIGAAVSCFIPPSKMRSIAIVDPLGLKNPLAPCGVCTEMLQKIQRESPDLRLIEFPDFENERFALITSWFPGRLARDYDPNTVPQELHVWECLACGFPENGPHSTRCMNCKEETRSLPDRLGKNLKAVLKALLEMQNTCFHTSLDFVDLDVPAHEAKGPITQTKLCLSARRSNIKAAARELSGSCAKLEKQFVRKFEVRPESFLEQLHLLSPKVQRTIRGRMRREIVGLILGLSRQGRGGIFKQIAVGEPGRERQEFAFTEFGKRYISKI